MNKSEIGVRATSRYAIGDKLCGWNPHEIAAAEVEFLMGEYPEEFPDEDAAYIRVWEDYDLWQLEWNGLVEHLTEIMRERGLDQHCLLAEMYNFGWRSTDGFKPLWVETGQALLGKVLPDTENYFDVYAYGDDGLAINNRHHDSPRGREWYYIRPLKDGFCRECGCVFFNHEGVDWCVDGEGNDRILVHDRPAGEEEISIAEHDMCTGCWQDYMEDDDGDS